MTSRPINETPAKSGGSVVKRAPISSARQARLEAQRTKERNQRLITGFFAVVLVAVLAFAVFQLFPRSGAPSKSSAPGSASVAQTFGVPADYAPGGKSKVKAQGKITSLPDGVQYIDIKIGSGATAKSTDTVTTNYIGWLTNGTKFDSSYDRGQPAQFPLNQVIKGWTEGLAGMQIGGERRLLIPAAEGYGAQGSPPTIPANATLVFDVTLVSIP